MNLRPVFRSVGPPDLVGRPGAHSVLFGPAGLSLAAGGEAGVAVGRLLRHHLGHQVADGAAHVGRAGEGGGGDGVGAAGGQGVVVGVLQGVQGVGLAAGDGAHGGASAGGAVLGGAPRGLRAGHGGRDADGGQAVRAQSLHLGYWLWDGLLP